jgi:hypothetical protein
MNSRNPEATDLAIGSAMSDRCDGRELPTFPEYELVA